MIQKLEVRMFLNKKTRVTLTGSAMAVVRYIQQLVEVLTGEYVELESLPIVLGPVEHVKRGSYCPVLQRNFTVEGGRGQLYPSLRRFTIMMSETMTKKDKSWTATRWELWQTVDFALTFEGQEQKWFSAKWKYSNVLYPEVWVIDKYPSPLSPHFAGWIPHVWKVGRDRTERREEPLFE